MFFRRIIFSLIALFIILNTKYLAPVFASDSQFSSDYDVTYKVNEDGNTTVTQNVHLTNLTSDVFASEYVLRLNDPSIYNLHAIDRKGTIKTSEKQQNGHVEVNFKFNEHITGLGKTLHWTLTYDTPKIAKKIGRLWEITIPPPELNSNTKSYTIGLYVPKSFGLPQYLKPEPNLGANLWNITSGTKSGISAAYFFDSQASARYQSYNFSLKYHLQNTGFLSSIKQIAIPPDTNYQKVFLTSVKPTPQNVTIDSDGNWIASYSVAASSILTVEARGSVAVFDSGKKETKTPQNLSTYLSPRQYWDVNNTQIEKKAKELKTPEKIYDYVVNLLHYDKNRIVKKEGRLGGVKILSAPKSAICMEFTDLFISLSRAAGIPAREVDGFGFTTDQQRQPISSGRDVLHAWPEYFDSKSNSWRMVDPTWGNTTGGIDYFHTFDFDHISFVLRGQNSTTPMPAGSYKIFQTNFGRQSPSKDIEITPVSGLDLNTNAKLTVLLDSKEQLISPFSKKIKIRVKNSGVVASKLTNLDIKSAVIADPQNLQIDPLPPLGSQDYFLTLKPKSWNDEGSVIISFEVNGERSQQTVSLIPFYKSWIILFGGVIFVFISILTKVARGILFQKHLR